MSISSIWLTSITSETSFRFSAFARVAQQPQPFFAEALEAVRRAARLEGAAAEDLRAGPPHRRRGGADLLLALRRARAGHDDHFVAADPDVADGDDRAVRLERAAGQLVRLGDPQHFVDAVEHLDQPVVGMPLPDRAEHRARDAGRAVHVHAHLHEPRDDLLDLRFGGPFFHHYYHGFCLLQYRLVVMSVPLVGSSALAVDDAPFEPARLVDDPLEQPRDRVGPERPFGGDARGRAPAPPSRAPADRPRCPAPSSAGRSRSARAPARSAAGPALRRRDRCRRRKSSSVVSYVRARRTRPSASARSSSTRSISSRRPARLGDQRHQRAADDRGVGVGADFGDVLGPRDAEARARSASPCARESAAPAPRRPTRPGRARRSRRAARCRRETRCPSSAAFRIRASVVVGLSRKIVSRPAAASVSRNSPASSIGRSSASTPSTPAAAARRANASSPIRSIGLA